MRPRYRHRCWRARHARGPTGCRLMIMSLDSTPVRRSHLVKGATPADLYAVVTDFAAYPRLFREIKTTREVQREGNRQRVEFKLEMVVAIRYVLDLVCDPDQHTVDWTYVEGEIVTGSA